MVYNISKRIGIPSDLKGARKQLDDLINHKEPIIRTDLMKGKFLCIKRIVVRPYGRKSYAYPVYMSKNKLRSSIVCKKVK